MAINTTGAYNKIVEGNITSAIYETLNQLTANWFVPILFFTFLVILIVKTKNVALAAVSSLVFMLAFGNQYMIPQSSKVLGYTIMVLLFGATIVSSLMKKKGDQ